MAQPWRLPEVNGDDGAWGDILNQFLNKEHNNIDNSGAGAAGSGGHMNITLIASTGAAGTQPITFNSGTLLSPTIAGALEFNADRLYFTQTTSTIRRAIATYYDGTGGATGDTFYRDANGYFTNLPAGANTYVLTSSGPGTIPSWGPPVVPGLSQQQVMAISSMRI
jgi:hypothetical protein